MSEVKIKVPEGMLQAGRAAYSAYVTAEEGSRRILEAALLWLAENPIMPKTFDELPTVGYLSDSSTWGTKGTPEYEQKRQENYLDGMRCLLAEWQRRMFLAPVMEVPKSIATAEEVVRLLEECLMDASSRARLKLEIERLARKGVPPMPK